MYWDSLAAEIRDIILEALAHEGNVAHCATVCQEWQAALEKHNFHSLNLRVQDIPAFEILGKRKLSLVRYVWYSIELQEYDCTACERWETGAEMEANMTLVKDGLRKILCALGGRPTSGNLTLDISVHSPSDSQHQFKCIRFEPANRSASHNVPTLTSCHGPVHTSATSLSPFASIERVFTDIEIEPENEFWTSVSRVPCVTRLLLRRQTRRRWESTTVGRLLVCFPNLQELCFEPWREWDRVGQMTTDLYTEKFFQSLVPNKLKKLVVFEDLNETYISAKPRGIHEFFDPEPVRESDVRISWKLAEASLGLQHLSAAFVTDASQFWEVRKQDWVWESLLTLSLTSRDLVPYGDSSNINDLLCSSAEAIKKMPQIQTMELWNGAQGYAAVFRYKSGTPWGYPSIKWKGSWMLELEPRVVAAWRSVAERSLNPDLQVQNELLRLPQIQSHGEAIITLELELEVACPVSIQQIHREHLQILH